MLTRFRRHLENSLEYGNGFVLARQMLLIADKIYEACEQHEDQLKQYNFPHEQDVEELETLLTEMIVEALCSNNGPGALRIARLVCGEDSQAVDQALEEYKRAQEPLGDLDDHPF